MVQNDASGVAGRCLAVGGLELAENLGFTQNHGIETGGHAEKMSDGFFIFVRVDVAFKVFDLGVADAGPAVQHLTSQIAFAHGEEFHAVTCGKDERFMDGTTEGQSPCAGIGILDKSETLTDVHGSSAVVQTN